MTEQPDNAAPPPDDAESALQRMIDQQQATGATAIQLALDNPIAFTPLDLRLARLNRDDVGNAERLMERSGKNLAYVREMGWLGWDKTRWSRDDGETMAQRIAQDTHKAMFAEAKAVAKAGRWPHEDAAAFNARVGGYLAWAIASGNAPRLRAMLECATPHCTVKQMELDKDPFLFNLKNGTLDLREPAKIKLIRPHRPEDRITRISPVKYQTKATCDLFKAFLNRVLPDKSVQDFIQQYAGYSLTGDTSAQVLVLMWGTGANGKSTLDEVLRFILGDYAKTVAFESLTRNKDRRGSEASPDLARLRGARAAFAAEPEHSVQFSEGLIKQLTGGEPINARFLNKEFFEYTPEFKLWLAFNNKPTVRGTDTGIWRRLLLVPFTVTIPESERDPDMVEKLKAEASGILNWILEGYVAWRKAGRLVPPAAVVAATEEYRQDSDSVGQFIADVLVKMEGCRETAADLFGTYQRWCKLNAKYPFQETGFGTRMGQTFARKKSNGVNVYDGVRIADDWRGKSAPHADDAGGGPPQAPPPEGIMPSDDAEWPTDL